jgi:hypothetical protein
VRRAWPQRRWAQFYGYSHDPLKLRTAYLDYVARQGVTRTQMVDIKKRHDASMAEARGRKVNSCLGRDSDAIRVDLRRYQAGYFAEKPRLPSIGILRKNLLGKR